jgi:hypothetical protein
MLSNVFSNSIARRRGGILKGCLIAVTIAVVLLIIGGVIVAMNFKKWASSAVVMGLEAAVNVAEIPAAEKPEIVAIIKQVQTDYLNGDITLEEIGQVLTDFETNPAIAMGMVMQFEASYVTSSSITDEQKADARITLNRIAQGLADGTITWNDTESIIDHVSDVDADGTRVFRQPASVQPKEVLDAIEAARTIADDAGIGTEYVEFDLSDQFKAAIEKSLGRALGSP